MTLRVVTSPSCHSYEHLVAWTPLTRREHCSSACEKVLSDIDLVALILLGNIGPATFARVGVVCRAWRSVCRTDERVLRGVAAYQGGLTKAGFVRLFALSSKEADAFPRTSHNRHGGGSYFLYKSDAVDEVLAADGMSAWRARLLNCSDTSRVAKRSSYASLHASLVDVVEQEERLHARECGCSRSYTRRKQARIY